MKTLLLALAAPLPALAAGKGQSHARFVLRAVLFLLTATWVVAGPPLIVTGWDSPNAAQFRQNLAEFEKLGLFEGTNIDPT